MAADTVAADTVTVVKHPSGNNKGPARKSAAFSFASLGGEKLSNSNLAMLRLDCSAEALRHPKSQLAARLKSRALSNQNQDQSQRRRTGGSVLITQIRTLLDRSVRPALLHAFVRIPRALHLAHVDDLADVVGVVGADIGDGGCQHGQLLVVGGFD